MGKNILVAHGGGPTAVINSSLQGVIEAARESGRVSHIYGARFGAEGILLGDLIDLTNLSGAETRRLACTPASAIGSCRRKLQTEDRQQILDCFRRFGIDCFLYNGGNDSMDTCHKIQQMAHEDALALQVIGIPKTIDNDLAGTDHCPGYGSAARYAAINAAELALDASALPIHIVVMEVMGRNAGWIAAATAWARRLTTCEQLVYLPESPVDEGRLLADAEAAYAKGKGLLLTVSEGICGLNGKPFADSGIVDGFGHAVPGGTAQYIASLLMKELRVKARAEKPGLLGRTSMLYASPVDRREAYAVGAYAVCAALGGESGKMVSIDVDRSKGYRVQYSLVPLEAVANVEKRFPSAWLEDGNGIADAFFDYAAPLIGGDMPEYTLLR